MFICLEKNVDNSHPYQIGGKVSEGWAEIPKGVEIPGSFPYVDIIFEDVLDEEGEVISQVIKELVPAEKITIPAEPPKPSLEERISAIESAIFEIAEVMSNG